MSTFNRGLDDAFVEALNKEYDKGGWWRAFVDDKEVFVAIRRQRVDAYYRGCLLVRLDWRSRTRDFVGQVHYKYLLHPDLHKKYMKIEQDGQVTLPNDTTSWFLNDLGDIDNLKKAVKRYTGDEKKGVHDILEANTNVFDVEIAFGRDVRLDFAALQGTPESVSVVFFEAKHYDNMELRARGGSEPKVIGQIDTYACRLSRSREPLERSYRCVCDNLLSLRGVAERYREHHAMLRSVANGSLSIDNDPVLIVFGYDRDQMERWEFHRNKLEERLPGRVYFRGASKGFTRGISKDT